MSKILILQNSARFQKFEYNAATKHWIYSFINAVIMLSFKSLILLIGDCCTTVCT